MRFDRIMDYRSIIFFLPWLYMLAILIPATMPFGFDSATSCSPKASRKGRAQLIASIPCDLTQQAYCIRPGPSYPWHAVRRFVHENQGLMKRMYGDVRHISILRTEIQNNEIDVEDIQEAAARYSRNGFRRRSNKLLQNDFQNMRNNDVLTEPHFRPASTTTTTTTTTTTPPTSSTMEPPITAKRSNETTADLIATAIDPTMSENDDPDNNIESNSILETSTSTSSVSMDNIKVVPSPNLSRNKTESATISTTLRVVQQIIQSEIEAEEEGGAINISTIPEAEIFPSTEEQFETSATVDRTSTVEVVDSKNSSSSTEQLVQQSKPDTNPSSLMEEINKVNENFVDKKKPRPAGSGQEAQLFQDTVEKDTVQVGANMRGVNACPVKEEVVAPFWANNTRGEVLALLNLYPFEQYVHWEKCTNEHKQMYCRDGCRCEQQYRLHRLLAYDPHNECRGIFSDWFRFPSCCICKCYDIPVEFRSTSRSPRTLRQDKDSSDAASDDENAGKRQKQPLIDRVEDEVQRAIYEHATEDWYRPRDEYDFYED